MAEAVDRLLADELAKWNQDFTDSGLSAPYTGVELTQFRLLSSYPDLLKEGTVKLYAFDYGLTTGNLEEAGWAGGNYADGDGLFHPYGHVPHLLTVEGIGHMERSQIILWEFPLVVGSQGYELSLIHIFLTPSQCLDTAAGAALAFSILPLPLFGLDRRRIIGGRLPLHKGDGPGRTGG